MEQQNPTRKSIKQYLLYGAVMLFGTSAMLGIFTILFDFGEFAWKILATTVLLAFVALLSLNNIARLENGISVVRKTSVVALICNIIWSVPWILLIWGAFNGIGCSYITNQYYSSPHLQCDSFHYDFINVIWRIIWITVILSVAFTITSNFLSIKNISDVVRRLKIATIVVTVLLALFLELIVCLAYDVDEFSIKIILILFIIEVFLLITTPILAKIQSNKEKKATQQPIEAPHQPTEAELQSKLESELRTKIEAEVRAQIAAEQQGKIESTENTPQDIDKTTD